MAPEQVDGSGRVGPRTDVWAVGATLYEVLSGAAPRLRSEAAGCQRRPARLFAASAQVG